jgi:hypothetical protein
MRFPDRRFSLRIERIPGPLLRHAQRQRAPQTTAPRPAVRGLRDVEGMHDTPGAGWRQGEGRSNNLRRPGYQGSGSAPSFCTVIDGVTVQGALRAQNGQFPGGSHGLVLSFLVRIRQKVV